MNLKEQPMVSVWFPCYNHEKYVREAIESILNQTFQDFELIIIENGSTDHSREIIKEYEDRATVIYFDENDLDKAVQVALGKIQGKYSAPMNSDDIWLPDKLEKQIDFLEKHPEYQACFTWAEYGDENMNPIYDYTYTLYKKDNKINAEWLKYFIENGNCLCAPSTVMRTKNYLEVAKRNIGYWQLSDLVRWIRFLLGGNQLYIYPEVLVKMRRHGNAISYSDYAVNRAIEEQCSIAVELMEQIPDELFYKGFSSEFLRPDCKEHEEFTCEKILYLFRRSEKNFPMQPRAFDFFYRHYSDDRVAETLKEKYNMDLVFLGDLFKEMGIKYMADYYYIKGREDAVKEFEN